MATNVRTIRKRRLAYEGMRLLFSAYSTSADKQLWLTRASPSAIINGGYRPLTLTSCLARKSTHGSLKTSPLQTKGGVAASCYRASDSSHI